MVKGVITTLLAIVPNMVAVVEAVVRVIMQVFPLDRQEDLGVAASMEQEVEVEVSGTVPQEEVRAVLGVPIYKAVVERVILALMVLTEHPVNLGAEMAVLAERMMVATVVLVVYQAVEAEEEQFLIMELALAVLVVEAK